MIDEIQEIRRIRHEISARHGHDLKRLLAYYKQMEDEFRKSGTYRFEESPFEELKTR